MSSSDLPKLWTEVTKIGHIFRKQSTLKSKFSKKLIYKSWFLSQIFFTKKIRKIPLIFYAEKDFETTKFAIFEEVVHNFGRLDDDMI